ncbi:MAG: PrsW family intramembrane metalloprotease [Streptosporangiales bacterium]|nr:PrsW family intramembrane metalloprotease [Streptosporangiales bacterium]
MSKSRNTWVRDTLEGRSTPRRPTLAVLGWVGIGVCGLVALGYGMLAGGPGGFLLGALFAILPVPLLVFAVLSLDRIEPEPTRNLVLAFAWGAAVSVVFALLFQIGFGLVVPGEIYGATIAAPISEELAKGLIIFLILHVKKTELDGPTDGLVYAGMVGLGFAMSENIVYYGSALADGAGSLVATFVMRGIFSPLAHPLFTAATGVALGFAALKRDAAMRWLLPIGGVILAMILHALWNGSTQIGYGIGLILYYLLIMLPILVACILIAFFDRRRVLRQIATHLPAYAPSGIFSPDEVALLSTMKARRKMRHLMRDYQQAATELAMLDDHAARGTAGPEYGPRREALVRILMLAKQAFPGNQGIARNLAEIEGTLPPPPLSANRRPPQPVQPRPGMPPPHPPGPPPVAGPGQRPHPGAAMTGRPGGYPQQGGPGAYPPPGGMRPQPPQPPPGMPVPPPSGPPPGGAGPRPPMPPPA